MSETEKAQGDDYGAYTIVDPDKVLPGYETDFSIVGFGWGKKFNPTWNENQAFFKDFKRKLLYSTFQHGGWTAQKDFITSVCIGNKTQAYFLDVERSEWGLREDLSLRQQALDVERILRHLRDMDLFKVGLYSNFYDYYLLSLHVDLSSFPWWAADPGHHPEDHPGSLKNWRRWAGNRELYDYTFDQYDWKGFAPNYGAINGKKSMDLTQCKFDLPWVDNWLGLTDTPPPQPEPPDPPDGPDENEIYNQALEDLHAKTTEAKDKLKRE